MPNSPIGKVEADTSRDILESLAASECMLTAKQLAKLLAVCPETLYTYVSSNLIPHCKIGTHFRFRGKDIAEWLLRQTA